jgi:hypothetical protein
LAAAHWVGNVNNALAPSWSDEEELGIRVFVVEAPGARGIEVRAYAEGVRPELRRKALSVSEKGHRLARRTVLLDQPGEGRFHCAGSELFGTAAELRQQLGETVTLDVFLLE